jgi:hypothetical protein
MKKALLNHAHPDTMNARYIAEAKKISYQQRFEKFIAIYELSYLLKTSKRSTYKDRKNE